MNNLEKELKNYFYDKGYGNESEKGTGTVGRFLIRVAVAGVKKTAKMCITNLFF